MAQIKFTLDTRGKGDTRKILMRISHQGGQIKKSTGLSIPAKKWNKKFNIISGTDVEAIKGRDRLAEIKRFIESEISLKYMENLEREPTMDELERELAVFMGGAIQHRTVQGNDEQAKPVIDTRVKDLIYYIDEYCAIKTKVYSPNTMKAYNVLRRTLIFFSNETGESLLIKNITNNFVEKYSHFLVYDEVYDQAGGLLKARYENVTMEAILKKLNAVIAHQENLPLKPFRIGKILSSFKINKGAANSSERAFCEIDEIMSIYNYKANLLGEDKVKDLFVFTCFTGLRHSELYQLTEASMNEKVTMNERFIVLNYISEKTGKPVEVPLNNICLEIIEKWRTQAFVVKSKRGAFTDRLLPVISNAKCNIRLHDILFNIGLEQMKSVYGSNVNKNNYSKLKKIGFMKDEAVFSFSGNDVIDHTMERHEFITFHAARHSFGAYLLDNGMSIKIVSEYLGHDSIQTTETWYKHRNQNVMNIEMLKITNIQNKVSLTTKSA